MPFIDRKSSLTAGNARASDVAARMVEHLVPIQQQRMISAFRVQGIQAILYSHLTQGKICTCKSANHEVAKLSPDGKADSGTINRVLAGNSNFGISSYLDTPEDEFDAFDDTPTSPNSPFNKWLGDLKTTKDNPSDDPTVEDDGQASPDLEDMLGGFDLSSIGYSDVACPICFGSGYVGGFSMMGGFRKVLVPSDLATHSTLELPSFALSPGTHQATVVFPMGCTGLDVFRAMNGPDVIAADFSLNGQSLKGKNILRYCDGRPHLLEISTQSSMTHVEIQFATTKQSLYFEIPRLSRSADISFLEQQEPFQIIVSPDIPMLKSLDVIAESQRGKFLIVQSVNEWNTRTRQMLGHEVMVRVAQPQELYRILPLRLRTTDQKTANAVNVAKSIPVSGLINPRGRQFTF